MNQDGSHESRDVLVVIESVESKLVNNKKVAVVTVPIINNNQIVVTVLSEIVTLTVDTGCDESSTSLELVDKLGITYEKETGNKAQYTANALKIPILGKVILPVQVGNLEVHHEFKILENLVDSALLGLDFLKRIGANINLRDNVLTYEQEDKAQGDEGAMIEQMEHELRIEEISYTADDNELIDYLLEWEQNDDVVQWE